MIPGPDDREAVFISPYARLVSCDTCYYNSRERSDAGFQLDASCGRPHAGSKKNN